MERIRRRVSGCYVQFKPPGYWVDEGRACVYCGWPAETKDHVPPMVWVYSLGETWFLEHGFLVVWVPCCRECNSELGSRRLFCVGARTAFLRRRYQEKYVGLLTAPAWTDGQIGELRGRLQQYISDWRKVKHGILRRIEILAINEGLRPVQKVVYRAP